MLEPIIAYINSALSQLLIFNDIKGLAEIVNEGERSFPAIYCGGDELDKIEVERGVVYHRQISTTSYENIDEGISGCEDYVKITYPLQLVAHAKRNIQQDNAFSPGRLSDSLISVLKNLNFSSLLLALKADDIQIYINSVDTDKTRVWEGEYRNVEYPIRQSDILLNIGYTIEIGASQSCLKSWGCLENITIVPPDIIINNIVNATWDTLPGRPECLTQDGLCDLPFWDDTAERRGYDIAVEKGDNTVRFFNESGVLSPLPPGSTYVLLLTDEGPLGISNKVRFNDRFTFKALRAGTMQGYIAKVTTNNQK